jgi:hypothetical protein
MAQSDQISPELRARAEANALFWALHRGELNRAAEAQQRLRQLGWNLTREQPKPEGRKSPPDEPGLAQ